MDSQGYSERGQVAIENLMLYAGVLTVIIVILGALWQTGVFDSLFGKRGYVGFSQLVPEDWTIGSDMAYITFRNTGETILVVPVNGVNLSFDQAYVTCALAPAAQVTLRPSETWVMETSCPTLSSRYEVGEYFEADGIVDYINTATSMMHRSVGKIYGRIELIPPGWEPPTTTTVTTTTIPRCFNHQCMRPGEMDDLNCGDIVWRERCRYCPKKPDPVDGKRKCHYDGSCGWACTIDADCDVRDPYLNSLNLCKWCNTTVGRCEENDDENQTPERTVTCQIFAHNGSGFKVVNQSQTIYLDVTGRSSDGVEQLLVSNSIVKPATRTCKEVADDRNDAGPITDPYGGAADPLTRAWIDSLWGGGASGWNDTYALCGGATVCQKQWGTNESDANIYCYFAAAQKYAGTGSGEWSEICADYIQVGFLQVFLVFPRPL